MDVLCQNAGSRVSSTTRMLCGTLMNMHQTLTWKRRNCYRKSFFLFSLRTKISRSFIKVWLSHWCYMDDHYYLSGHWMCQLCCSLWKVRKLSDFIKNILICVPKMNKGLYRFETTRGWAINDRILLFGWTIPLTQETCSHKHTHTHTHFIYYLFIYHYFYFYLSYLRAVRI